jgi:glycosyltransferase involved in cell wall biosynthesis
MTVCYFGIYDRGYARSTVLLSGLAANGVEVIECHVEPRTHKGLKKFWALYLEYQKIRRQKFDFVIVAFPGHTVVWLAKLLFNAPLVFDAFVSLYDSNVFDRLVYSPRHPRAWIDWMKDYISMHLSDAVLMDTNEHAAYCADTFRVRREKFVRVMIGANDTIFSPREVPHPPVFTVHFHGTFIPLQGISYIVEAAKLLLDKPIAFRIAGSGQEYARIETLVAEEKLSNVELLGMVPLPEVPKHIAPAHICLGIFGNTPKTSRVIPNKVYEYMAMGKAIITADTPAVRELEAFGPLPFVAVPSGDAQALADAILSLMQDDMWRERLEKESRTMYVEHLQAEKLVKDMLDSLAPRVAKTYVPD